MAKASLLRRVKDIINDQGFTRGAFGMPMWDSDHCYADPDGPVCIMGGLCLAAEREDIFKAEDYEAFVELFTDNPEVQTLIECANDLKIRSEQYIVRVETPGELWLLNDHGRLSGVQDALECAINKVESE